MLLASAVVVAVPDSRHAVARWLGLERLPVEVVGSLPPAAPGRARAGRCPLADAAARAEVVPYLATTLGDRSAAHAPGGRYVAVRYDDGGTAVLVTTLPGRLDDVAFRKLVASGVQVTDVEVGDDAGVWITGEPHVFLYEGRDGGMAEARPAADTLAWQEGDVIVRVEGDIPLARALAVAAGARAAPNCRKGDVSGARLACPGCPTPRCVPRCSRWRRWRTIASASRRRSTTPCAAPTRT